MFQNFKIFCVFIPPFFAELLAGFCGTLVGMSGQDSHATSRYSIFTCVWVFHARAYPRVRFGKVPAVRPASDTLRSSEGNSNKYLQI
jgi:hypothetical protein